MRVWRRLFVLLRREGEPSGIKRIHRLYREEGLAVRKRRARRKAVGVRVPILLEARPNARWSLDFVYDQFANRRRFRVLNIVDDVTKECLGAIPDTSISGRRVARELTAIVERRATTRLSGQLDKSRGQRQTPSRRKSLRSGGIFKWLRSDLSSGRSFMRKRCEDRTLARLRFEPRWHPVLAS
jgi:transposase InsO family protein